MGPHSSAPAYLCQQCHCFTTINSGAIIASMTTVSTNKKAKITPETLEEAKALRAIWDNTSHPSQAEFGERYNIGNQSAVGQFLRGAVPLSMNAAQGFALGLGCSISDFSPRLGKIAGGIAALVDEKYFNSISPGGIGSLIDKNNSTGSTGSGTVNRKGKGTEDRRYQDEQITVAFGLLGESLMRLDEIGRKQAQPLFEALIANPEKATEFANRYVAMTNVSLSSPSLPKAPTLSKEEEVFATNLTKGLRSGDLDTKNIQRKITARDTRARSK